jgi:CSLREA domain-containing protein
LSGSGNTVTWTAPVAGGPYTITAASTLDPSAVATAQVTVTSVNVQVTPTSTTLFRTEPATFTATVSGAAAGHTAVGWTMTCGTGVPAGNSLAYTAPATPGDCSVTATSVLDPTRSATVIASVRSEWLVTTLDDNTDGACTFAHCSLREALTSTNGTPAPDVILLGTPTGSFTTGAQATSAAVLPLTGVITLSAALPEIVASVEIRGPGANALAIDAAATPSTLRRIFRVTDGAVASVSGVSLINGKAASGGAILVDAGSDLTLSGVILFGNQAVTGPGGAVHVTGGSSLEATNAIFDTNEGLTAASHGAAVAVDGVSSLIVQGGVARNNILRIGGRGAGFSLTQSTGQFANVLIEDNVGGAGIAAWQKVTLTVTGGFIRRNSSRTSGGGILLGAPTTLVADRSTGTFTGVVVEQNTAQAQGGGIQIVRNADASLTRLTVRGNSIIGPTGGAPGAGGGLHLGADVTAIVTESSFSDNQVNASIAVGNEGGGGIAVNTFDLLTRLTLIRSTVSGNTSIRPGGGILVYTEGQAIIENSTISGNSAPTGGGIMASGAVLLNSSTVIGNTATGSGGGISTASGGGVSATYVLLSNNHHGGTPSNCLNSGSGVINSMNYNLSDDATCATFVFPQDRANTTAGISPLLADNGGPTKTHALLAGSAALDAGAAQQCPMTDQRGASRIGLCDIGAYEFNGVLPGVLGSTTVPRMVHARRGSPAKVASSFEAAREADLVVTPPERVRRR